MENEVKKIGAQFGRKTILLPDTPDSDCYAVYSKEEYKDFDEHLLVNGKAYKHRLYFYKKTGIKSDKILSFIFLNPGTASHIKEDTEIKNCVQLAKNNGYGAIEIFSVFTLRTIDKIDSVSEDAILDAVRVDLSGNDILLAFGENIKRTAKYKNLSTEDLKKINKVRKIKINSLLDFLMSHKNCGKIYTIGLTKNGNPKSMKAYTGQSLILY